MSGNVWRFPFIGKLTSRIKGINSKNNFISALVAYANGGGAFLIPYLIVLLFIGRPLYFLEMVLGQFSSSGSVKAWSVVPIAKGIRLFDTSVYESLNSHLFEFQNLF